MAPNIVGKKRVQEEISHQDINNNDAINQEKKSIVRQEDLEKESANSIVYGQEQIVIARKPYRVELVWRNIIAFLILHTSALYGLYLVFAELALLEFLYSYALIFWGAMGVTAGAHRLWSHRSYKARLPFRIFLMLCNTMAFQNSIYEWTLDHRVHHKYTDTNADPHNSRRGFFFAHMGWLMCRKHPDVKAKGKQIDMSDLKADPVVMFQKKYYGIMMPVICFLLPPLVPYLCWGTSFKVSFFICSMLRYTVSLHGTWLVNSAAHFYGMRPYDKSISSVNSKLVSSIAFGEGWHNYHHVFPWDYKAAELGNYINATTGLLNLMSKIGQVYDMKTVSKDMLLKRIRRTGDGSHPWMNADENNNNGDYSYDAMVAQLAHEKEEVLVWGWEDADVSAEDRKGAHIIERK